MRCVPRGLLDDQSHDCYPARQDGSGDRRIERYRQYHRARFKKSGAQVSIAARTPNKVEAAVARLNVDSGYLAAEI